MAVCAQAAIKCKEATNWERGQRATCTLQIKALELKPSIIRPLLPLSLLVQRLFFLQKKAVCTSLVCSIGIARQTVLV
jgi:hypothetical protein